jgi:TctA family transporter
MIGKAEWFERRKYGGWGMHPKTWQGWAYIGAFMIALLAFHLAWSWDDLTRAAVTIMWAAVLGIDTLHMMAAMKSDEREKKIEALSERNAAWAMIAILTAGILTQLLYYGLQERLYVDPFLVGALAAGVIAKSMSNYMYERKPL